MLTVLPEKIRPLRLARQGEILCGMVPLAQMSRLREELYSDEGTIKIEWRFHYNEAQRPYIEGHVTARLCRQCQRCLQLLDQEIRTDVNLEIVAPGNRQEPVAGFELLELEDKPIALAQLVEDELLLALPLMPRHEQCPENEYRPDVSPDEPEQASDDMTNNPFQALAALKQETKT